MLKNTICAGLAVCMAFFLCSCESTTEIIPEVSPSVTEEVTRNEIETEEPMEDVFFVSVMLGDKNIEEWNENNVIANVSWNSIKLSEMDETKFPNLKNSFAKYNDEAKVNAQAAMYELSDIAKDLSGDEFNPLYLEGTSKIYVQRADTKVVSCLEAIFVYSGGIHPDLYYKTVNFDPKTGNELILTDIMSSIKQLPDILDKEITDKYSYINFADNQPKKIFEDYSADDYKWTIDYQGVTFWFSPYDIAAYTVGPLSVKLYFDENPYIKDEYKKAPAENFVVMLPNGNKIDFDLDTTDDIKDCIEIDEKSDQYGNYRMLSVTINGKIVADETNYAYDFDVYLAHIGNKNYIYSQNFKIC